VKAEIKVCFVQYTSLKIFMSFQEANLYFPEKTFGENSSSNAMLLFILLEISISPEMERENSIHFF